MLQGLALLGFSILVASLCIQCADFSEISDKKGFQEQQYLHPYQGQYMHGPGSFPNYSSRYSQSPPTFSYPHAQDHFYPNDPLQQPSQLPPLPLPQQQMYYYPKGSDVYGPQIHKKAPFDNYGTQPIVMNPPVHVPLSDLPVENVKIPIDQSSSSGASTVKKPEPVPRPILALVNSKDDNTLYSLKFDLKNLKVGDLEVERRKRIQEEVDSIIKIADDKPMSKALFTHSELFEIPAQLSNIGNGAYLGDVSIKPVRYMHLDRPTQRQLTIPMFDLTSDPWQYEPNPEIILRGLEAHNSAPAAQVWSQWATIARTVYTNSLIWAQARQKVLEQQRETKSNLSGLIVVQNNPKKEPVPENVLDVFFGKKSVYIAKITAKNLLEIVHKRTEQRLAKNKNSHNKNKNRTSVKFDSGNYDLELLEIGMPLYSHWLPILPGNVLLEFKYDDKRYKITFNNPCMIIGHLSSENIGELDDTQKTENGVFTSYGSSYRALHQVGGAGEGMLDFIRTKTSKDYRVPMKLPLTLNTSVLTLFSMPHHWFPFKNNKIESRYDQKEAFITTEDSRSTESDTKEKSPQTEVASNSNFIRNQPTPMDSKRVAIIRALCRQDPVEASLIHAACLPHYLNIAIRRSEPLFQYLFFTKKQEDFLSVDSLSNGDPEPASFLSLDYAWATLSRDKSLLNGMLPPELDIPWQKLFDPKQPFIPNLHSYHPDHLSCSWAEWTLLQSRIYHRHREWVNFINQNQEATLDDEFIDENNDSQDSNENRLIAYGTKALNVWYKHWHTNSQLREFRSPCSGEVFSVPMCNLQLVYRDSIFAKIKTRASSIDYYLRSVRMKTKSVSRALASEYPPSQCLGFVLDVFVQPGKPVNRGDLIARIVQLDPMIVFLPTPPPFSWDLNTKKETPAMKPRLPIYKLNSRMLTMPNLLAQLYPDSPYAIKKSKSKGENKNLEPLLLPETSPSPTPVSTPSTTISDSQNSPPTPGSLSDSHFPPLPTSQHSPPASTSGEEQTSGSGYSSTSDDQWSPESTRSISTPGIITPSSTLPRINMIQMKDLNQTSLEKRQEEARSKAEKLARNSIFAEQSLIQELTKENKHKLDAELTKYEIAKDADDKDAMAQSEARLNFLLKNYSMSTTLKELMQRYQKNMKLQKTINKQARKDDQAVNESEARQALEEKERQEKQEKANMEAKAAEEAKKRAEDEAARRKLQEERERKRRIEDELRAQEEAKVRELKAQEEAKAKAEALAAKEAAQKEADSFPLMTKFSMTILNTPNINKADQIYEKVLKALADARVVFKFPHLHRVGTDPYFRGKLDMSAEDLHGDVFKRMIGIHERVTKKVQNIDPSIVDKYLTQAPLSNTIPIKFGNYGVPGLELTHLVELKCHKHQFVVQGTILAYCNGRIKRSQLEESESNATKGFLALLETSNESKVIYDKPEESVEKTEVKSDEWIILKNIPLCAPRSGFLLEGKKWKWEDIKRDTPVSILLSEKEEPEVFCPIVFYFSREELYKKLEEVVDLKWMQQIEEELEKGAMGGTGSTSSSSSSTDKDGKTVISSASRKDTSSSTAEVLKSSSSESAEQKAERERLIMAQVELKRREREKERQVAASSGSPSSSNSSASIASSSSSSSSSTGSTKESKKSQKKKKK